MSSSEENEYDENLTPPEIQEAAKAVIETLLPPKSKEKYLKTYESFVQWKNERKSKSLSENVFLAYFGELAKKVKPTTLWVIYSMLKCTVLMKHNVNLKQYGTLTSMLKRQSDGYKCKKSKVFNASNVKMFLFEAPDSVYLDLKVILIFGIFGACRCNEITNIAVKDVENHDGVIIVTLRDSKTKIIRTFVVRDEPAEIVQKYIALRPRDIKSDRFFLNYKNNKCTKQVIGRHKIATMPKAIATYLNLPNPEYYTGHCFRRSSASVLADTGANLITLKRHRGWKSDQEMESYIEEPIENKNSIIHKINESIKSQPLMPHQLFQAQNYTVEQETSTLLDLSQTNNAPTQEPAARGNVCKINVARHGASSGKLLPKSDAGSSRGAVHEGCLCYECGNKIVGFRYTCVQCASYELCAACEARGAHADHYVLRVPGSRPEPQVRAVLKRIREQLLGEENEMDEEDDKGDEGDDEGDEGDDEGDKGDDKGVGEIIKMEVKVEEEDPLQCDPLPLAAPSTDTRSIWEDTLQPKPWTALDEAPGEIKCEVQSDDETPLNRPADTTTMTQKRPADTTHEAPLKRLHLVIDSELIEREVKGKYTTEQDNTGRFACKVYSRRAEGKKKAIDLAAAETSRKVNKTGRSEDSKRRSEWLRLISREDLSNIRGAGCTVCEEHFNEDDVLPTARRKKLKTTSLPCLRLPISQKNDVGPSSGAVHEGFQCNECIKEIVGFRYTCVQCANYDLCAACEMRGAHANHYVLRVPRSRPELEVRAVLEQIREQLLGDEMAGAKGDENVTAGDDGDDAAEDDGDDAAEDAGHEGNGDEEIIKIEVKLEEEDPLQSVPNLAAPSTATENILEDNAQPKPWTKLDEAIGVIKCEIQSDDDDVLDTPAMSQKGPADSTAMPQKRPADTTHQAPLKRLHSGIDSGLIVKESMEREVVQGKDTTEKDKDTGTFVFEVYSHCTVSGKKAVAGTLRKVNKIGRKIVKVSGKTEASAKKKKVNETADFNVGFFESYGPKE